MRQNVHIIPKNLQSKCAYGLHRPHTESHMVLLFDPSGVSAVRRCILELHECLHIPTNPHLAYLLKSWQTPDMTPSLPPASPSPMPVLSPGCSLSSSSDHHRHQPDAPLHLQPGPRALRPRREAGRLLSGEGGV